MKKNENIQELYSNVNFITHPCLYTNKNNQQFIEAFKNDQ